eukprot:4508152-Pyramimonas_sp.AAC.1
MRHAPASLRACSGGLIWSRLPMQWRLRGTAAGSSASIFAPKGAGQAAPQRIARTCGCRIQT